MDIRLTTFAVLAITLAVVACGRSDRIDGQTCALRPAPALAQPISPGAIDGRLFDEALLREVNGARCGQGLAPLALDRDLTRAAEIHSADMARIGFFSHESPVSGRARLADRFREAGVRYRHAAENIATVGLYQFGERQFVVRDRAACDFAFTRGGPPIPRHSYESAARVLVERWMASPGHRRNILQPQVSRHGGAIAYQPDARFCGSLIATETFAG